MLDESQLNVYVLDTSLSPRQRERLQAQVQTALRSLPRWVFSLLSQRIESLDVRNLPLIVEARSPDDPSGQIISFGEIEGRPAARLMPRLLDDGIEWEQDARLLVAKAAGFMARPPKDDGFWRDWTDAIATDQLREVDAVKKGGWSDATDLDLFLEMFAAYVTKTDHERWTAFAATRAFFDAWRDRA
ncbi:MAG: hypothetical protein IH957_07285 [Chloroflexi bacterium]|nr:hypothetical protein [Chloroflexota bacterium]